jgi:hypothetical protein
MSEEPTFETENVTDTEQLIADIEALISRIKLLRIHIAMYLLSSEVSPQGGKLPTAESFTMRSLALPMLRPYKGHILHLLSNTSTEPML